MDKQLTGSTDTCIGEMGLFIKVCGVLPCKTVLYFTSLSIARKGIVCEESEKVTKMSLIIAFCFLYLCIIKQKKGSCKILPQKI